MTLKIPPVAQLIIVGLGMIGVSMLTPYLTILIPHNELIGLVIATHGIFVSIGGVIQFRRAITTVDPRYPEKTERLVVKGLYRYSRNPMYVGFSLTLIGLFLILSNLASLALIPVFVLCMNQLQIKPEERFLLDKFGEAYAEYCRSVRRWI